MNKFNAADQEMAWYTVLNVENLTLWMVSDIFIYLVNLLTAV